MPVHDRQRLAEFDDPDKSREFARVLGQATHWWYRRCASRILAAAPAARHVLDLGIGPGHLLAPLTRCYPEASFVGIDISEAMLRIARAVTRTDSVALVRASFERLPFRESVFDLVTATGLLHHADDPCQLFREARRVLAPGGRLVALGFRRDASRLTQLLCTLHSGWLRRRGSRLEGGAGVLRASWTTSELRIALAQSGFRHYEVSARQATLAVTAIR